jgi:hypothetical protein
MRDANRVADHIGWALLTLRGEIMAERKFGGIVPFTCQAFAD